MPTESDMDNILVKQKDIVLSRINSGALNEAQAILNVLRELWFTCDYGYKWTEVQRRIFAESDKTD